MDRGDLLKELRIERAHREPHGPGGRPRWPWFAAAAALVLLALGGAAWWWLGQRAVDVRTAVATAPAGAAGGGAVLQATGYVTARRQATVSAQITGTLTEVLIEEGDTVKKGQVLARLEDSAYRASLDAAQAAARAAEAQVVQVEAQRRQAEADARRQEALVGPGLVARQAAEQARTAASAYAAQLKAQRRQAEAARAQVAQAQVNFGYTVIRAPFDGVVTDKAAQVGEIISPLSAGGGFTRTGVGTIVDMDSLEVDVDVNEAYIGRVKPQMPAEAVLDAYPDWRIPAHVIAIVPAADRGKATVKVRVALERKDARIVPDMGVRVSFLEARPAVAAAPPKGALVPAEAIVERAGRSVVFVVADGRAAQRAVTPAAEDYGAMKRLPAAVQPGERVVLAPPAGLRDGARVREAAQ
ncbi:efflux RND transporter periplasmic adaptor subunit [Frateuria defendens]|uniref:efflux RND transporter periplasmic adaptor subunit n=1 Tax=Frateuria defendens TaxID=2219559 RepID=UPI00066FD782|nr:efflux RND transporter periplasmic adaptor subunit [Frateuria defendens]